MKKNNLHLVTLAFVFVLSTMFFWSAINNYLYPSRAQQAGPIQILFIDKQVTCSTTGICAINIFGTSQSVVGAISGLVEYDAKIAPQSIAYDTACAGTSFGLDSQLQFTPDQGKLKFAVGAMKSDPQLIFGNHCIGSLIIKPAGTVAEGETATIKLGDATQWKVGGSSGIRLTPQPDVTPITITFSASANIPTLVTPTPLTPPAGGTTPGVTGILTPPIGGGGAPGTCPKHANGDCSCNAVIDLVDWESLRASFNNEAAPGAQCDLNGDGVTNKTDLDQWKNNNEVLKKQ